MSNYIVTAIYDDLFGTDLGGRPSRGEHYRHSFKSISKINSCKYIIYTNSYDSVKYFIDTNIDNIDYNLISYDLRNIEYSNKINRIKNIDETKNSYRCIELQYSKLSWLEETTKLCNENDYIYWFDAGLSYSGLIPDKYLDVHKDGYHSKYFYSILFNNIFFENLVSYTGDKIFCIGKNNIDFFWDDGLPDRWYVYPKNRQYHIIGGLFGGKNKNILLLCKLFKELANNLLDNEPLLYSEENILTTIFYNQQFLFNIKTFDIWWHENNISSIMGEVQGIETINRTKSFYQIIEDFQTTG